jgi:alpha-glucosidase
VHHRSSFLDEFHLPFNFQLIETPWDAVAVQAFVDAFEQALPVGAWPNYVLGNHDRPRLATRYGTKQVRIAAMLLLTLRGTPTLYYGDELGMAVSDLVLRPHEGVVIDVGAQAAADC